MTTGKTIALTIWTSVSKVTPLLFNTLYRFATGTSLVAQRIGICLQCGIPRFNPWVGKIPWRRKWQPIPVFLPGESHGQRSLVGYSPQGRKESDMTEQLHSHRFATAFHSKSKLLLISWLQLPSAVILEPTEKKICHCFQCFPIYLP